MFLFFGVLVGNGLEWEKGDRHEASGIRLVLIRLILRDDLGGRKVWAKLVPRLPTSNQNETRQGICQDGVDNWGIFDRMITGDGS